MLVVPEGQVWSGNADRVIAKTLDGDIGILTVRLCARGQQLRARLFEHDAGRRHTAIASPLLMILTETSGYFRRAPQAANQRHSPARQDVGERLRPAPGLRK